VSSVVLVTVKVPVLAGSLAVASVAVTLTSGRSSSAMVTVAEAPAPMV